MKNTLSIAHIALVTEYYHTNTKRLALHVGKTFQTEKMNLQKTNEKKLKLTERLKYTDRNRKKSLSVFVLMYIRY